MNSKLIIDELNRNKEVFRDLLKDLPKEIYLWREAEGKWCLLEVLCHLIDEEREDFGARVKSVLENPELPLNSIDPVGWVRSRKYIEQNYNEELNRFVNERAKSVEWLIGLKNPQWDNKHKHPKFGDMSAKMFLSNWLAHDFLHIRQVIRIKYNYCKSITGEDFSYAGNW